MTERKDRSRDMTEASWSPAGADPSTLPGGAPRVGDLLRQRREELRYDLSGVAASLRIRQTYLQAIEDGVYADLPAQTYIIGFLRSYADLLGLDAAEIVDRFKNETAGSVVAAELYMPIPANENRVPGGLMLIIAGVLGVVLYGGWYFYFGHGRAPVEEVSKVPDRLAAPAIASSQPAPAEVLTAPAVQALLQDAQPTAPEVGVSGDQTSPALADSVPPPPPAVPAPSTVPPATGQAPVPGAAAKPGAGKLPSGPASTAATPAPAQAADAGSDEQESIPADMAPAAPPPSPPGDTVAVAQPTITAAPTPQTARSGRVFGITSGTPRVIVRATEETWIQVRDGKGTVWASRVLHPGDSFRAPDVAGLTLETGNAGGLVVSLDGHDLPPLGAKSQVRRGVSLQPDALAAHP